MEPDAVLRSQLSVRGQFQNGSEDIFVHCQYLTAILSYVVACTVRTVVYDVLESVTVLSCHRNYRDIITVLLLLLLLLLCVSCMY